MRRTGKTKCSTSIRYIHNSSDMSLNWSTREQKINLVIRIPETTEVFDHAEGGLSVGNCYVHVMLF